MDWYKVYKGFWDNPKIKYIESLPEGDTILVIFHKMLDHLCKCESLDGEITLGGVSVDEQMLHVIFARPIMHVRIALEQLQLMKIIEKRGESFFVSNWPRYQTTEKMIEKREQNRIRQQRFYENQKLLKNSNALETRYSRNNNATELEVELEVELELEKECVYKHDAHGIDHTHTIYHDRKSQWFPASEWLGIDPEDVLKAKKCFKFWIDWYEPSRRGNVNNLRPIWEHKCQEIGIDNFLEKFGHAFSFYCGTQEVQKKKIIMSAKKFLEEYENWFDQAEIDGFKPVNFWERM